jgi:hypothetical protein
MTQSGDVSVPVPQTSGTEAAPVNALRVLRCGRPDLLCMSFPEITTVTLVRLISRLSSSPLLRQILHISPRALSDEAGVTHFTAPVTRPLT